jgi:hypothetical protein
MTRRSGKQLVHFDDSMWQADDDDKYQEKMRTHPQDDGNNKDHKHQDPTKTR